MFPKPKLGSGTAARRSRKRRLEKHRAQINTQALARDKDLCQICGAGVPEGTSTHHVHGRSGKIDDFREQVESRLTLCSDCHVGHHDRADPTKDQILDALERQNALGGDQ